MALLLSIPTPLPEPEEWCVEKNLSVPISNPAHDNTGSQIETCHEPDNGIAYAS
ncbi:hypothetical protein ASAP_2783 [Asaia bogorensis]|uniref:Uncharacterized protein n=1 Tax=Asaia bogorensis TaxID=91915 RepID=A0A060QJH5_9PROT|nr:hypothetical protein ASAP_2783 [Asaia bogorensis]